MADLETKRPESVLQAFRHQANYCRTNTAPITARVADALADCLDNDTATGRRVLGWAGHPIDDALPLRLAGGVRALYLAGDLPQLAGLYAGAMKDAGEIAAVMAEVLAGHDVALLPWLDGPPQTNEAGRSASYIAGMQWLADKGLPPRFEMLEIGSSAGINLMIDRYRYNLAGVTSGPVDAAISLTPEWRGPPPPDVAIGFDSIKGCDVSPVHLTDPVQATRLKAYIWPEHLERYTRLDSAIALAHTASPNLVAADAANWIAAQLSVLQPAGVTRILVHSIVWQYLGAERQDRISALMAATGEQATMERPLAWLSLETNHKLARHELWARFWPDGGEPVHLGNAHAHGAWVEWF